MAEHGLDEPVIGVSFDGTGLGTDGAIWGGEFLVGDYAQFRRTAHLRYVGMPGGDKAIREPWRMAVAHLLDAGCSHSTLDSRITPAARRTMETMLERGFNAPRTSSAGRLFDAVASIAGIRDRVSFEGQAAQQLEWLATAAEPEAPYPFEIEEGNALSNDASTSSLVSNAGAAGWNSTGRVDVIDTRPVIRAVLEDVNRGNDPRRIARRFHSTVVEIIHQTCCAIRDRTQLEAVVLSGGVFMNALLAREVAHSLLKAGFCVYQHRLVPPNDGGLSLGQLAVAAATVVQRTKTMRSPRRTGGGCRTAAGISLLVRVSQRKKRRNKRMCLAIPGKVVDTYQEHEVLMGKVDFGGVFKRVCLEHTPGVQLGQYVIVHVGFALEVIDEAEAKQVFTFLEGMNELSELQTEDEA